MYSVAARVEKKAEKPCRRTGSGCAEPTAPADHPSPRGCGLASMPVRPPKAAFRRRPKGTVLWPKNLKSRASRLAKPDARHHGSREAADPAHKPASSVDAVRVPQRRRESAGL